MVGIVLASHGAFAEGISQSAEMIFGKQENFGSAILKPDEGPDDVRKKMENVINSFDNQDEVLFLIDLWGGTPLTRQTNCLKNTVEIGQLLQVLIYQWLLRLLVNGLA